MGTSASFLTRRIILYSAAVILLPVGVMTSAFAQPVTSAGLKASENGHYFLDRTGKPFFWQGDTEWELFRYLTARDAGALLAERKKQGFNVIQVMVTGVFQEWGVMTGMNPWKGIRAWKDDNPLTPDDNYFKRVDSVIDIADKLDIILVIGVYHARDNDAGRITALNARQWAAWLAGRYRNADNIVYSMYPHADPASATVIRGTASGILESDGGNHYITMHPDPSPASSSFMHNEFWLSFNTLQTWSTNMMNYDMVRADYERWPFKPVVDGEARYEAEDGTTPFEVRRVAYWSCLAGGFYSYGHRDNWKSPATWRRWYDSPGAQQMKIMGDFFRSYDWWNMIPDQTIFEKLVYGNVASRSSEGDWIVAYLTDKSPVTIKLKSINARKADCWWMDPVSGARTKAGSFNVSESTTFSIPEGWQDAVLYIEKAH